ncbi:peptidase S8/S53 domain-containing protein, partial [Cantharellus anzutake]|uniref:peptidase S8/S53 domain-containing protein n=1 Tax=Cantharellus anzutake TaxID=1750568 RepID=UPI0019072449
EQLGLRLQACLLGFPSTRPAMVSTRTTGPFLSFILSLVISVSARTFNAPNVIPSIWKLLPTPPLPNTPPNGLQSRMRDIALAAPGSPGRQWLTQEEVAGYVGATPQVKSRVESALAGIPGATYEFNLYGDQVTVKTVVGEAAEFLSANFKAYQYNNGPTVIRALSVTIPPSISDAVIGIFPLLTFGQVVPFGRVEPRHGYRPLHAHRSATNNYGGTSSLKARAPTCDMNGVTLQCIREIYNLTDYTPRTPSASDPPSIGIMAYINQNYDPLDLKTYLTKYRPEAKDYCIDVVQWDDAVNVPVVPGVEAALDTQTVAGLVWPLKSTFYDVGTYLTQGDPFLLAFNDFLDMPVAQRPTVITVSYGDDEGNYSKDQANMMCAAAEKLSCMGMTIVFSAGDNGVNGGQPSTVPGGPQCPPFRPTYPSGCPFILSGSGERATGTSRDGGVAGFYGGSGFSTLFDRPFWQNVTANQYIRFLAGREEGNYNEWGRVYPDVAAQGSKQKIVVLGQDETVGGTSASAPIVASIIALMNARIHEVYGENAGSLGWVHPLFYVNSGMDAVWNDVVRGGSYGCDGDQQGIGGSGNGGFPATIGWDASTGWGTIDFMRFRRVFGM